MKFKVNKYDNIFIAGDLNTDTGDKAKDTNNYLCDFIYIFSLNDPIKVRTCYKSVSGTILDIIHTNKTKSFQKTSTAITSTSDCHKMIVTCRKTHFQKLPQKKNVYRGHKTLIKTPFFMIFIKTYFKENFTANKYHKIYLLKLLKALLIITRP